MKKWKNDTEGILGCGGTAVWTRWRMLSYHWTLLPRPLGATGPSIILCVKKWSRPAPQPRGSSHSPEGKNRRVHLIKTERRGYKKILLVEFQDIYKSDLQNLFRPNRVILRGVLPLGTQIPRGT